MKAFSSLYKKMKGGLVGLMKFQKQGGVVELVNVTDVSVSDSLINLWNKRSNVKACYLFPYQVFPFNYKLD